MLGCCLKTHLHIHQRRNVKGTRKYFPSRMRNRRLTRKMDSLTGECRWLIHSSQNHLCGRAWVYTNTWLLLRVCKSREPCIFIACPEGWIYKIYKQSVWVMFLRVPKNTRWLQQEEEERRRKGGLGLCCLMTPDLSKGIRCHVWPYFY